ncbi:hypothetical protein STEG23_036230, partial [Scotinomys teguina]
MEESEGQKCEPNLPPSADSRHMPQQGKSNLQVTSLEDAACRRPKERLSNGNPRAQVSKPARNIPRRHTLGGPRSSKEILGMQTSEMDRKREAFLEHLKQKYPHHATAIMGHQERLRDQKCQCECLRNICVGRCEPMHNRIRRTLTVCLASKLKINILYCLDEDQICSGDILESQCVYSPGGTAASPLPPLSPPPLLFLLLFRFLPLLFLLLFFFLFFLFLLLFLLSALPPLLFLLFCHFILFFE